MNELTRHGLIFLLVFSACAFSIRSRMMPDLVGKSGPPRRRSSSLTSNSGFNLTCKGLVSGGFFIMGGIMAHMVISINT